MSRGRSRAAADTGDTMNVVVGRRAPYTQVGNWLLFAAGAKLIRPPAVMAYTALAAHLNTGPRRGEDDRSHEEVNPTLDALAEMLGYSSGSKLRPYLDDLESINAIEIRTELVPGEGNQKRNVYTVHQAPPLDWPTHETLGEFYRARNRRRREERAAKRAAGAQASAERAAAALAEAEATELAPPEFDYSEAPEQTHPDGVPECPNGHSGPEYPFGHRGSEYPNGHSATELDVVTRIGNENGGRAAAPRTPAVLPAGRVTSLVSMSGDQQGDHQTAYASARADSIDSSRSCPEHASIDRDCTGCRAARYAYNREHIAVDVAPAPVCDRHPGGTTALCGPCTTRRRDRETWDAGHAVRVAQSHELEERVNARLRAAEIAACRLCDIDGYRGTAVCDHTPTVHDFTAHGMKRLSGPLATGTGPAAPTQAPGGERAATGALAGRTATPEVTP